jgi:alpha-glucosidase
VLRDPVWERAGHTRRGRDACRVPVPWEGDAPPFGFSVNPNTWLPIPTEWAALTVQKQLADADSTLSFFRRAIELRRSRAEFGGSAIEWLECPGAGLVFRVSSGLVCALNTGRRAMPLPDGELLLSSGPLVGGKLPRNTAVWLV